MEKPIINVIYQEPKPATTPMGCLELGLSLVVIVVLLIVFGIGGML